MDHIFWNHDKVLKTFDKPVCDQWSGYDDEGFKSHVTAETALVKVPESHRLRTSFVWSRSLTRICSCLFRLLSLHSHCHVNQLRRLLVWLMFTVSDLLSEVKKKLNNDGVFFSTESHSLWTLSCRRAISMLRCHFQAYSSLPAELH